MIAFNGEQLLLWSIALVRVSGIVAMLPGMSAIGSMRLRVALVIALTALVGANSTGHVCPDASLPLVVLQELALGICFGFGIRVMFVAAQVLAELLLHSSGLAQVAWQQAMGGQHTTGVPRFLELTFITVFFATNGHRIVASNLLRTLVDLPAGALDLTHSGATMMLGFLARAFELGVYTSFPLLASAGIALAATGIIHRLVPQLASVVASAGVGYVVLLFTLMIGIGAVTGMFESGLHAYADMFSSDFALGIGR